MIEKNYEINLNLLMELSMNYKNSQQYNIELQKSAVFFSELNKSINEVSTNQPGVEKE